jgi:hypothetical protein
MVSPRRRLLTLRRRMDCRLITPEPAVLELAPGSNCKRSDLDGLSATMQG